MLMAACAVSAQQYPPEWQRYMSDGYYHDIESADSNQTALNLARTNLARQIQVHVKEMSKIDKDVVNGHSSVKYSSTQNFSTDVDMNLAESKSYYSDAEGRYNVLVYIDKAAACTYYENEVKMLISNSDNTLDIAANYISTGFKQKAKAELEKVLRQLEAASKSFFWLNVFGLEERKIQSYLTKLQGNEQTVKQKLADLEYGTTYCVVSDADLFGQRYVKLASCYDYGGQITYHQK